MRLGLLLAGTAIVALVVAACGVDLNARDVTPPQQLAIVISEPNAAVTLPQGTPIKIRWTAANTSGIAAKVNVVAESRQDLKQTPVLANHDLAGTGESGECTWTTLTSRGPYVIRATITNGTTSRDVISKIITIDGPPHFKFTAPTDTQTIEPNATPEETTTITFIGSDESGTAKIGLDPDIQHSTDPNDPNSNEIYLKTFTLAKLTDPNAGEPNSFTFNGKDSSNNVIPAGTYHLFAQLIDGVNPNSFVDANVVIAVLDPAAPEDDPNANKKTFAIDDPNTDVTLLTGNTLRLQYQVNRDDDVLVDLKVDPDDDHANGNEVTIYSQRYVPAKTGTIIENWNGNDVNGAAVPVGIYHLVAYASTGSGTPTQAVSGGLIMLHSNADQALVTLIKPTAKSTLNAGSFLDIAWRDDIPTGTAKIRLTLNTDPAGGAGTEREILASRDATADGVQDTFQYQVPPSLPAGTYYVFAYITRDGQSSPDTHSQAAGKLVTPVP